MNTRLVRGGKRRQLTVGVVITNFNHREFVIGAIYSVLHQSRPVQELIIVDDASTDGSREVLHAMRAHLPGHVRLLLHDQNVGVVVGRNEAALQLGTDLLLFLDSDDELLVDCIKRLARPLERAGLEGHTAFAYSPSRSGDATRRGYMHTRRFEVQRLAKRNFIPNTALMRRDVFLSIGGYSEQLDKLGHEDWDLFLTLAENGWQGQHLTRPLFFYRQSEHSRNAASMKRADAVRQVMISRHPWIAAPDRPTPWRTRLRRLPSSLGQRFWRVVDMRAWRRQPRS